VRIEQGTALELVLNRPLTVEVAHPDPARAAENEAVPLRGTNTRLPVPSPPKYTYYPLGTRNLFFPRAGAERRLFALPCPLTNALPGRTHLPGLTLAELYRLNKKAIKATSHARIFIPR